MFEPLHDYILVKPDPLATMATDSGIEIVSRQGFHDPLKQFGRTGTVVAVGEGKRTKKEVLIPLIVKVGERIAFGEYDFPKYVEGTEKYLILQEADIEGILE